LTKESAKVSFTSAPNAGDWVVVASRDDILATLDATGCIDKLPFQPEMLAFCGQTLRVASVAHKTCDNIHKTGGRRMLDAVHLEGTRCSGAAHGGCMADCEFFWKLAWLRPATPSAPTERSATKTPSITVEQLEQWAAVPSSTHPSEITYRCQTTELYNATTLLPWWDLRQYVRDVTSGNHSVAHMLRILAFAVFRKWVGLGLGYRFWVGAFNALQRLRGGMPYPTGAGPIPRGSATPFETLNLTPGEWVEVKSQDAIVKTLTVDGFNRGMRFDVEMSQYAGGRFKVEKRVDRLIDERNGRMLNMKTACIQLENVYCRATCTPLRLGCPRKSKTYWREIWLQRVDSPRSSDTPQR
jgi:hypothetical protein